MTWQNSTAGLYDWAETPNGECDINFIDLYFNYFYRTRKFLGSAIFESTI